jgi:hypothetical protein
LLRKISFVCVHCCLTLDLAGRRQPIEKTGSHVRQLFRITLLFPQKDAIGLEWTTQNGSAASEGGHLTPVFLEVETFLVRFRVTNAGTWDASRPRAVKESPRELTLLDSVSGRIDNGLY